MPFTKQPQGGCKGKEGEAQFHLEMPGKRLREEDECAGWKEVGIIYKEYLILCLAFKNFTSMISLGTVIFPHFIDEK